MLRLPGLLILTAALWPAAPALAQPDIARATERCEQEVAETVRRMRGSAAKEVQFVASRRVLTPQADDETAIRGEGRYRSASGASVGFTYGCAYRAGGTIVGCPETEVRHTNQPSPHAMKREARRQSNRKRRGGS